jgi:hypothetical protein
MAWGPAPDIFTRWLNANWVGRVLELSCPAKVIRPSLGAGDEPRLPFESGNTYRLALTIMRCKDPLVKGASQAKSAH